LCHDDAKKGIRERGYLMKYPKINVSLKNEDYKRVVELAERFDISQSELCRNLIRASLYELMIFDKLKKTDFREFMRNKDRETKSFIKELKESIKKGEA
jgi:hypothetical protein